MSKRFQKIIVYLMLFAMLATSILTGLAWILQ